MVKRKTLLFLAGLVWSIAGFNILKIGITTYSKYLQIQNFFLSSMIFLIFWFFIFNKLVIKHTNRIHEYQEEKKYFWNFFDVSSFMIMIFMMTMGISIRSFHLLPDIFIAVFYSGLGFALFMSGIKFFINYFNTEVYHEKIN